MKIFPIYFCVIIFLLHSSCKKKNDTLSCPYTTTTAPYDNPIAHPSGKLIGFNYTKVLSAKKRGDKQCGYFMEFEKQADSTGFWLLNADGTNRRLALPFKLGWPSWNAKGDMIVFSLNSTLYTMPFDGESFDQTKLTKVGVAGSNYNAHFSPSGNQIVYRQTTCAGLNPCGFWVSSLKIEKNNRIPNRIGDGMADWKSEHEIIYTHSNTEKNSYLGDSLVVYNSLEDKKTFRYFLGKSIQLTYEVRVSPNKQYIGIISFGDRGGVQLFRTDINGTNLIQLTTKGCGGFSWLSDQKIAYINTPSDLIDENYGTIWTMDVNGNNKKQITFNN